MKLRKNKWNFRNIFKSFKQKKLITEAQINVLNVFTKNKHQVKQNKTPISTFSTFKITDKCYGKIDLFYMKFLETISFFQKTKWNLALWTLGTLISYFPILLNTYWWILKPLETHKQLYTFCEKILQIYPPLLHNDASWNHMKKLM